MLGCGDGNLAVSWMAAGDLEVLMCSVLACSTSAHGCTTLLQVVFSIESEGLPGWDEPDQVALVCCW